jgi:CheY-like chemotaxis protein
LRKNYSVTTCNGRDVDLFENENFDVVFLDENMPGMSGLETLQEMKEKRVLFP